MSGEFNKETQDELSLVEEPKQKDEPKTETKRRRLDYIKKEEVNEKIELIREAFNKDVEKAKELESLPKKSFLPLLVIKDDIFKTYDNGATLKDMASSLSAVFEVRVSVPLLKEFISTYDDSTNQKRKKALKKKVK